MDQEQEAEELENAIEGGVSNLLEQEGEDGTVEGEEGSQQEVVPPMPKKYQMSRTEQKERTSGAQQTQQVQRAPATETQSDIPNEGK